MLMDNGTSYLHAGRYLLDLFSLLVLDSFPLVSLSDSAVEMILFYPILILADWKKGHLRDLL